MGIATYMGRIWEALHLKQETSIWIAIGRTTAWDDEENPPDEDPSATTIEEPIVYVKPADLSLVKVVTQDEDVEIDGVKYAFVADEDAYDEDARFVYFQAFFNPGAGQPHDTFRQHGIFTGLEPAPGHENDDWLAPANVSDVGIIQYIENHEPLSLGASETKLLYIVIEFR